MRFQIRHELPSLLILAGMFLLAAATWPEAPERIPSHWGFSGDPDGWSGKFAGLLGIPLVALVVYVILLLLPRIDPERASYDRFAGAYAVLRTAVLAVIAASYVFVHLWIRGQRIEVGIFLPLLLGVLLVVVGQVLGSVAPNWFVGIRTPWTLTSDRSWRQTHAAGRWVFTLGGALFALSAAGPRPWALVAAMGVFAVACIGLIVYSYRNWRLDPERRPLAG
jgi:uncharacterized membrane protein